MRNWSLFRVGSLIVVSPCIRFLNILEFAVSIIHLLIILDYPFKEIFHVNASFVSCDRWFACACVVTKARFCSFIFASLLLPYANSFRFLQQMLY